MKFICVFILIPFVSGLQEMNMLFSINFFKERSVRMVCLLVCQVNWGEKFAAQARQESVFCSLINIDKVFEELKLNHCLHQSYTPVGVLIDSQCNGFGKVMEKASQAQNLNTMHTWLILHDYKNYTDSNLTGEVQNNADRASIELFDGLTDVRDKIDDSDIPHLNAVKVLDNLNISVDAEITLAYRNAIDSYDLYDIFNFGKQRGGKMNIMKTEKWSRGFGFQMSIDGTKLQRRWDFNQLPLKMIVVSTKPKDFRPEMITEITSAAGINVITQVASMIIHIIGDIHNFRFDYTVTDRWIGSYEKNSTRVVANSLYFREQDLSPLIRITPEVFDKIDVVNLALTSIGTKFYYRIPTHGVGKFENQFLTPLDDSVWVSLLAASILMALVLFMTAKLERRPSSAQYAAFSVIALICQQFFDDNAGVKTGRASSARKITLLVTGTSCLIIYNYYTSSVVSWLLNGPPPSINSLQELLASPLELIFEDVGYTRSWLQTPGYYYNSRNAREEDELRKKKVFNKKEGSPLLLTLNEGIEMVRAGGYAYHTQVANANQRISQTFDAMELCELGSLQVMEETKLFPCLPKNSPYKEFFTWSLAQLNERGFVSCIQRRLSSPDISCAGSTPRPLALGGAAPAFIMLALGYITALSVLLGELAWSRRERHSALSVLRHRRRAVFIVKQKK